MTPFWHIEIQKFVDVSIIWPKNEQIRVWTATFNWSNSQIVTFTIIMYSPHKHSYLQSRTSGINPRLINRTVALGNNFFNRFLKPSYLLLIAHSWTTWYIIDYAAREVPVRDCFDKNPPFLRLSSEQPNIPTGNVDVTKRPLGFGRAAMPLLVNITAVLFITTKTKPRRYLPIINPITNNNRTIYFYELFNLSVGNCTIRIHWSLFKRSWRYAKWSATPSADTKRSTWE